MWYIESTYFFSSTTSHHTKKKQPLFQNENFVTRTTNQTKMRQVEKTFFHDCFVISSTSVCSDLRLVYLLYPSRLSLSRWLDFFLPIILRIVCLTDSRVRRVSVSERIEILEMKDESLNVYSPQWNISHFYSRKQTEHIIGCGNFTTHIQQGKSTSLLYSL